MHGGSIRFSYDDAKSAQAAAYLLRAAGGSMPYIKLMKLLYLADRQSLVETGYPITGAQMVSMRHGPVLSEVLERLTEGERSETPWTNHISPPFGDYLVQLTNEPDWSRLSEYEEDILDDLWDRYRSTDRWDLVRFTHTLPEWRDPGQSMIPIDPRDILSSSGLADEAIAQVASQAAAILAFRVVNAS